MERSSFISAVTHTKPSAHTCSCKAHIASSDTHKNIQLRRMVLTNSDFLLAVIAILCPPVAVWYEFLGL